MYVLHYEPRGLAYHQIGALEADGLSAKVAVVSTFLAQPGGADKTRSASYNVPPALLSEAEEALLDWLVSPEGFWPGGELLTDDEYALRLATMRLKANVKAKRDAAEWGGIVTPFGPVDTNVESQRKLGGASTAALALGAAFSKDWRMADDTIATLDAAAMITVGLLVVAHVDACQQQKNALDAIVEAATTLAEIEAIDIKTGWPS